MSLKSLLVFALLAVVAIMFVAVAAEDAKKAKHEYIGAKKCKICHSRTDSVYPTWEETAHATCYDNLTDEQKEDEKFLKYYTTGTTPKGKLLTGVQCEACHGPGSDYKSKKIMEDLEASIANGLIVPNEETCLQCHNKDATPALAKSAENWDYEKMKAKGVHNLYSEKEEKK